MVYSSLLAKYIFKLQEKYLKRETFSFLDELRESQWLNAEELEELQVNKLKKLLIHAYSTVPYYNTVMDKYECVPERINSLSDLKNFPYLTKDIIRENYKTLKSSDFDSLGMRYTCTTGSTGQYLEFYLSAQRSAFSNALELRNREWLGVNPFCKKLLLWGRPQTDDKVGLLLRKSRDLLVNKKKYICDSLNLRESQKFINEICEWQPEYLYCYAGAIAYVAKLLKKNDITVSPNKLKGIVTTAEVLYDYQRKVIEDAFATKVFNEYGAAECGLIAHECSEGSMHVNSENVILEVVNNNGAKGELVVTVLHSYGMPFIRYKIGDIGTISHTQQCSCGRSLPILTSLTGRTIDEMYSSDGKRLDSLVIDTISEDSSILLFRVHQKTYTELDFLFAISNDYSERSEKVIIAKLEELFGYKLSCNFQYKSMDEVKAVGKFRHITSDVKG